MAVSSHMVPLGTPAPAFTLPTIDGGSVSLAEFDGAPAIVVIFLSAHCPYVKHLQDTLGLVAAQLEAAGAAVVGVCSNDVERYPDDGPEGLREQAEKAGFAFPYLIDADQSVASAYRAACTPDFFVYDSAGRLAWRGQFDDSRPGNDQPVTGTTLKEAVETVLAGKAVPEPHPASIGCGIKWKPGNEPS